MKNSHHQPRGDRGLGSHESAESLDMGRIRQRIVDDPTTSILVAFGAGLGLGLLLAQSFDARSHQAAAGWFDRRTAEDLGQRLLSAMAQVLPASISEHLR